MQTKTIRRLLLVVLFLAASSLACGVALLGGEEHAGDISVPAAGNTVQVAARDFSFTLDVSAARAGEVTFVVENNGGMVHDFAIRLPDGDRGTPQLSPGESATLKVNLEPGTYTYVCTIPGHEQLGMRGTFTVVDGAADGGS